MDDYSADPDVALMLRVRSGDRSAFERLVTKHQKAVINAIYRYTGNPSVAEDLAQEVFLRIFRAAVTYQADARFTTWMFTIVRNICANYRTREGRYDRQMDLDAETEPPSPQSGPEDLAMQEQMKDKVRRAVSLLPESLRMPLILSHFNELPYEEVARVMDLSLAAVKVRIHRAKLMLADQLSPPVTRSVAGGLHE